MCVEAYVAGIIDGEGSIGAYRVSKAGYNLRCSIGMTDLEPLEMVREHFGGVLFPAQVSVGGHQIWRWQIAGRECQDFLRRLLPYLIGKDEQARLALDFPVMEAGARPSTTEREQRTQISQALKEAKRA